MTQAGINEELDRALIKTIIGKMETHRIKSTLLKVCIALEGLGLLSIIAGTVMYVDVLFYVGIWAVFVSTVCASVCLYEEMDIDRQMKKHDL